jgi:hypothetical protein
MTTTGLQVRADDREGQRSDTEEGQRAGRGEVVVRKEGIKSRRHR